MLAWFLFLRSDLKSFPFSGVRYWMLDVSKVYASGSNAWDTAVHDASEEYKHRMVREPSPSLRFSRRGANDLALSP